MCWPVIKALLIGHYRRYPLQFVLVWLGLTLGVSLFIGVIAINHHILKSYQHSEKLFANPLPYHILAKDLNSELPYSTYEDLVKQGFTQCLPLESTNLQTKGGESFTLIGVKPTLKRSGLSIASLSHNQLGTGHDDKSILISVDFAEQLNILNGQFITLVSGEKIGPVIIDQFDVVYGNRVLTLFTTSQQIKESTNLTVITCSGMSMQEVQRLKSALPDYMMLVRNHRSNFGSYAKALHMNLTAMGMLAFLVGLFIFYQAIYLSFVQRQPLVGMLRQVGVSGLDLAQAIIFEILGFIIISCICGNILGYLLSMYLAPHFYVNIETATTGSLFGFVDWNWSWFFYSFVLCIFGAGSACIWPLARLLQSRPIRLTSRLSLVKFAGFEYSLQALIAVLLLCITLFLFQFKMTPIFALVILGLILVAVGLLAPYIIWKVFDLLSYRLKHVKLRWFFADAAMSMSFRGVATMAFLIALTANIGVETLTGSIRATTGDWLKQRLSADLYVYGSPDNYTDMVSWLEKQPEVAHVWQQWEHGLTSESGLLQVMSSGSTLSERRSQTIKVAIPNYWHTFNVEKSILVSESMALKWHLRPGDYVTLPKPMGEKWLVAGVYYDYGNPFYQLMVTENVWKKLFGQHGDVVISLAVVEHSEKEKEHLRKKLMAQFKMDSERIYDVSRIRHLVLDTFDHTFASAQALGTITLIIAVVGIFFATIAGEASRQKHFALLRCFGVSNKELITVCGLQLLIFGIISLVISLPLGISLSQMVIDTLVKETFGWSIELHLSYWGYIQTVLYSLSALVLAGIIPIIKLFAGSPMKYFRDAL